MTLERLAAEFPDLTALISQAQDQLSRHGNAGEWQSALDALPAIDVTGIDLGNTVTLTGNIDPKQQAQLHQSLRALYPWRKGPFDLFGIFIDTEWRSDWKWQRLAPHLGDLSGSSVLDVGCGNGYFGWRLLAAGATRVLGVDPTVVFYYQHQAVSGYLRAFRSDLNNWLLPLPFEALPHTPFDLVLSMGVIYHRRDPEEHLRRLFEFTRPDGRLVLESLVVESSGGLIPAGRYARMRNLSIIPSVALLQQWLHKAGFTEIEVVDVTPTRIDEQRSTDWMTFESLAAALDPTDPTLTVEGHPAPVRAMLVARRP